MNKIGIIGAGAIGGALAKLAVERGHEVMLSSRHPEALTTLVDGIGCSSGTVETAARFGDLVVVAVPLKSLESMPTPALAGKVVVDTMNYYPERDGAIAALDARKTTTSDMVAAHLRGARLVKAFNAILARDLPADARPPIASGRRRALPLAGDDAGAKRIVSDLHDEFGFDVLDAGSLAESWRFERAKPAYCIPLDEAGLRQALAAATREGELPHGSWRR